MGTRRTAGYLTLVLFSAIFTSHIEAQSPPEEGLALHIKHGGPSNGATGRTFSVNPQFTTLDQPWDERFSQPFQLPEYISLNRRHMALMAGYGQYDDIPTEEDLNELDESGRRFVLSAETLYIKDRAWLTLENASNVNPQQGIIFDASSRGSLTLDINMESGYRYYIQFFIEPLGPGIFQIFSGSDQQQYQDPNGDMKSILVSLKPMSSGWARLELNRTFGTGFILHAVDVISNEE